MIIYISGRFRHYMQPHNEGSFDYPRMELEKQNELWWEAQMWRAGHVAYPPLRVTTGIEQTVHLPQNVWVERDLEMLRGLLPDRTCILMRPGWDTVLIKDGRPAWYRMDWAYDPSAGATAELAVAEECGFGILHGMHGLDAVLAEIARR